MDKYKPLDFTKLKPVQYSRKSSEAEDRQVLSINSQLDEAKRSVEYYKLPEFIEVFQEAKSAKKECTRPAFTEMINLIRIGAVDSIVCWKLDRLARNMTEGGIIIDLISAGVIRAIITHDKVYYPTDNVLLMAIEFGMGKQYVKDLSTNVKRGQTKKASMGTPHGVASLGFINDKTEEKGNRKWKVDEERFKKISILLKMFLTGEMSAGKLYKYAVEELKLTTVKRKKQGGNLIVLSRIYEILKDPIYAGFFFYNAERYELDKTLPIMITEDEHNKIKLILGKRNIPKTQTHEDAFIGFVVSDSGDYMGPDKKCQLICDCRHKFAYRNKLQCPTCETSIEVMKNPKYLDYTYYYNISRKKKGLKCHSVSSTALQKYLLKTMDGKIPFSKDLADWSKKHIKEMRDEEVNEQLFKKELLEKQAENYSDKKKKLRQMLADEMITDEEYRMDLKDLEEKYKPSGKVESFDWTVRANELVDLSQEFYDVMTQGEIKAKKSLLHRLGSNLIWDEEKLSINNKKSVQALLDGMILIKSEFSWFEPKKYVVNKGLNEKTDEFSSVFSTLLRE